MFAKRYYDFKYCWEEFDVGDQIWFRLGTVYWPKGRFNKHEMPRRQGLYFIVRKISLLVYELDLADDFRIYPMISIAYLLRYYICDDLFKCIPAFPGFVEYSAETDIFGDDVYNKKHWELECMMDYATRCSKTYYLVR